jgi:hypothetical protein
MGSRIVFFLSVVAVMPIVVTCARGSDRPPPAAGDTVAPIQQPIVAVAESDTFDLVALDRSSLPVRYRGAAFQWECPMTVRSMFVVLAPDSALQMEAEGDRHCSDAAAKAANEMWRGRYTVRSDSLEIDYDDDGSLVVIGSGRIDGDTLRIRDSASVARFARRRSHR